MNKSPVAGGEKKKTGGGGGRQRRALITGESLGNKAFVKVVHPKSPGERALIEAALRKNFVFEALSDADLADVVDCMARRSVAPGTDLIKQGDTGDYFYVIERGDYDIFVNGQKVVSFTRGDSFGELALLYNCPRAATCRSRANSEVRGCRVCLLVCLFLFVCLFVCCSFVCCCPTLLKYEISTGL